MAGYAGFSMSNNAVAAYNDGLITKSGLNAKVLKDNNIKTTVAYAKWLIDNGHWRSSEWHHTSRLYNITEFYDLEDLRAVYELPTYYDAYHVGKKKKQGDVKKEEDTYKVSGYYDKWEGSRRYGRYVRVFFNWAKLTGNWVTLRNYSRKRADGNKIVFYVKKGTRFYNAWRDGKINPAIKVVDYVPKKDR